MVAVLPGSRPQEVLHNLPPLVGGIDLIGKARPDVQFLLAAAPSLPPALFATALGDRPVRVLSGRTHGVVGSATVALVASGTATVETALLGTPMVVVYRVAPLTYLLGRPFVRVSQFAMVNLIAEKTVAPELIQGDFTAERVAQEALALLGRPRTQEADAGRPRPGEAAARGAGRLRAGRRGGRLGARQRAPRH